MFQVDVTDSHFNTALHLAAKDGREDLIPMLVEAGMPTTAFFVHCNLFKFTSFYLKMC